MQDIIGKKFGEWTVLSFEGMFNRVNKFKVKCSCGNESISDFIALTRGKSTKCRSCARKISCSGKNNPSFRHGYSSINHPQFHMHYIWSSMKQRCNNPKTNNYHRYGGRGIKVCKEWEESFENFLKDMGERPLGYSIDRIDNEKGYQPDNCKWVTKEENCNNTYKSAKHECDGENLSETQWARKLGLTRNKIMHWARKNGIKWVIDNVEVIKKTKKGMSDEEYKELGIDLPSKKYRD